MEQLRIGLPPRDASSPVSRLVFGLAAMVLLFCGLFAVMGWLALALYTWFLFGTEHIRVEPRAITWERPKTDLDGASNGGLRRAVVGIPP